MQLALITGSKERTFFLLLPLGVMENNNSVVVKEGPCASYAGL